MTPLGLCLLWQGSSGNQNSKLKIIPTGVAVPSNTGQVEVSKNETKGAMVHTADIFLAAGMAEESGGPQFHCMEDRRLPATLQPCLGRTEQRQDLVTHATCQERPLDANGHIPVELWQVCLKVKEWYLIPSRQTHSGSFLCVN